MQRQGVQSGKGKIYGGAGVGGIEWEGWAKMKQEAEEYKNEKGKGKVCVVGDERRAEGNGVLGRK